MIANAKWECKPKLSELIRKSLKNVIIRNLWKLTFRYAVVAMAHQPMLATRDIIDRYSETLTRMSCADHNKLSPKLRKAKRANKFRNFLILDYNNFGVYILY